MHVEEGATGDVHSSYASGPCRMRRVRTCAPSSVHAARFRAGAAPSSALVGFLLLRGAHLLLHGSGGRSTRKSVVHLSSDACCHLIPHLRPHPGCLTLLPPLSMKPRPVPCLMPRSVRRTGSRAMYIPIRAAAPPATRALCVCTFWPGRARPPWR